MLLAQMSVTNTIPNWLVVVIVVVPAAFLFLFTLMTILLRHLRANRALLHAERMRSIEAGLPLDVSDQTKLQAKYMHNAFWISLWLGFAVPASAFSAAAAATRTADKSLGLVLAVWICAAVAAVAAVVCATVLMINARCRQVQAGGECQKPPQSQ